VVVELVVVVDEEVEVVVAAVVVVVELVVTLDAKIAVAWVLALSVRENGLAVYV
jgi:hypothetical protein